MLLVIFIYITVLSFIIFTLVKVWKYNHAHAFPLGTLSGTQRGGKGEYGGSYYEETPWWEKPRKISLVGELKEMLKEMLFIKNLFNNQRPLWWLSYALHLGIYLLGAWAILYSWSHYGTCRFAHNCRFYRQCPLVGGAHSLSDPCTGALGAILVAFGSGSLFCKRILMPLCKIYQPPRVF